MDFILTNSSCLFIFLCVCLHKGVPLIKPIILPCPHSRTNLSLPLQSTKKLRMHMQCVRVCVLTVVWLLWLLSLWSSSLWSSSLLPLLLWLSLLFTI